MKSSCDDPLIGEEVECPDSPDGTHCNHWYDGDECCYCQAPKEVVDQ